MKASELKPGTEVAVMGGSSSWDLTTRKATRAAVVKDPAKGHVQVTLLEDANSGVGATSYGFSRRQAVKGDTIRVSTRQCWMPWRNLEARATNERVNHEQEESEAAALEQRLADLQHRVDQFAGEVDGAMAWGGLRHRDLTSHVRIPTEALVRLLDRAEGK